MQGIDAVLASVREQNKSEVARLLLQIRDEQVSAQRGLSGYAQVSQHQFITERMENMGRLQGELEAIVGEQNAMPLIVETLNTVPDVKPSEPAL